MAMATAVSASEVTAPPCMRPFPCASLTRNGMERVALPSAASSICIPRYSSKGAQAIQPGSSNGGAPSAGIGFSNTFSYNSGSPFLVVPLANEQLFLPTHVSLEADPYEKRSRNPNRGSFPCKVSGSRSLPCITGSKALLILMSMQNLGNHLGLKNTTVGVGFVTESAGNRHKPIYVQQFRVPFPSGLPG